MCTFLKKSCINFQNFPENMISGPYSLCFQNNCTSLNKVVYYIKRQLKLHHFLGWKGGGGKISPMKSLTFSCNDRNQYFLGYILAESTTISTN